MLNDTYVCIQKLNVLANLQSVIFIVLPWNDNFIKKAFTCFSKNPQGHIEMVNYNFQQETCIMINHYNLQFMQTQKMVFITH